jgi:hypothetical protein
MSDLQPDLTPRHERGIPTLILVLIGLSLVIVYQMTVQIVPPGTVDGEPYFMPWFRLGRDLLGIAGAVMLIWSLVRATARILRR